MASRETERTPTQTTVKLARARRIAEAVVEAVRPFCDRIEIAGSIRRQRPEPNDIDLVALVNDQEAVSEIFASRDARIVKSGPELLQVLLKDDTQIDFWMARGPIELPDLFDRRLLPGNFGSVLLCRTGSRLHNIYLVGAARQLGLVWHPHDGLFRDKECLASEEEEHILRALRLEFVPPDQRF